MAINRAPWTALVDDDGSNLTGSIWNKAAIASVILDPVDAATGAAPVNVPFSAANYAASGAGTWTGITQLTLTYVILNQRTLLLEWYVQGTVAGAPVWLYITLPGLVPWVKQAGNPFHHWGAATGTGVALTTVAETRIGLLRDIGGTPWTNGAYTIVGQIAVPT
jgi:hypothetical protein